MKHTNFINYSTFSKAYGFLKIDDIIKISKKNNSEYAVITDHMTCLSFPEFEEKCLKEKIKPIFGLSVSVDSLDGDFILIAKNDIGLSSLRNIVSSKFNDSNNQEKVSLEDLKKNISNLILITGNNYSVLGKSFYNNNFSETFSLISSIFNDDNNSQIILDIQNPYTKDNTNTLEFNIAKISHFKKIPIIATSTNRYIKPQHYQLIKQKFIDTYGSKLNINEFHIASNQFAKTNSFFSDHFVAEKNNKIIENTENICLHLIDKISVFKEPSFPHPNVNYSLKDILNEKFPEFVKNFNIEDKKIYKDRLIYEYNVIDKLSIHDYFLTFYSMANEAKKNNVAFAIRGSGSSSLIAHVLGISSIDPVKNGLLFERFLNITRAKEGDLPDIDFDTSDPKFVASHIENLFGEQNCAVLCNYDTIRKATSSLKFVKNSLLTDDKERDQLSINETFKNIDSTFYNKKYLGELSNDIKQNKKLQSLYKSDKKIKFFVDSAIACEGQILRQKRNPSSIIVSHDNIKNHVSLIKDDNSLVGNIAEVTKNYAEKMGFIKLDILPNYVIGYNLKAYKKLNIESKLYEEKYDDQLVYDLFNNKQTEFLFQIKQIGQNIAHDMEINNFNDIVVLMGLIRPGVPKNEIDNYIKNKKSNTTNYPISELSTYLDKSYGVIIFEEQIMQIAQSIGCFSPDESDSLRRSIKNYSKNKNFYQLKIDEFKNKFISNSLNTNTNYTESDLTETFSLIESKKNGYMFSESHARVYADICYKQSYIKAHYPAEFIDFYIHSKEEKSIYMNEILKRNIYINSPDINKVSKLHQTVISSKNEHYFTGIIPSLSFLNDNISLSIISERQKENFVSFFDFINRTLKTYLKNEHTHFFDIEDSNSPKLINFKKNISNLINVGFFDELSNSKNINERLKYRNICLSSLDDAIVFSLNPYIKDDFKYTFSEIHSVDHFIKMEKEIIGISPTETFLNFNDDRKKKINSKP